MNSQNNWKRFKHCSLVYLWAAEASKKKNKNEKQQKEKQKEKKEKNWDSSSVTDNSHIQSFI